MKILNLITYLLCLSISTYCQTLNVSKLDPQKTFEKKLNLRKIRIEFNGINFDFDSSLKSIVVYNVDTLTTIFKAKDSNIELHFTNNEGGHFLIRLKANNQRNDTSSVFSYINDFSEPSHSIFYEVYECEIESLKWENYSERLFLHPYLKKVLQEMKRE